MKKIFQTVIDKTKGNCTQAAIASLFELELNDVPNFIEMENSKWYLEFMAFFVEQGYNTPTPFNINSHSFSKEEKLRILKHDQGVKGYFYASVPSQTYKGVTHAVIIDQEMNVVHDPNPNQLALKLKPEDILEVDVIKDDWHINTEGEFIIENR